MMKAAWCGDSVLVTSAAIKEAVVNAVEELYISNRPPQEAAQAVIDLAHGCNLGELPSECHD